jgi:hypothetical protein
MAFFDARSVTPDEGRGDPIPLNWYVVICESMKYGPTDNANGTKAEAFFKVVEGPYAGRKIYHNFNLQNPSETAQKIGNGQMSALCHAVRNLVPEAPEQLCNIPLKIRVKIKPAEGQYEAKNEITAFKDVNDQTAVPAAASGPSAGPASGALPPQAKPWTPPAQAAIPPPMQAAPPPQQQWQPPAQAPQPWQQPAQQAPQPVQQMAPVQQPAQTVPPAWNPVAQDPNLQQQMQPAPVFAAPVQAPVQTFVPQQEPAPVQANPGQVVPPWMQGAPTA